MSAPGERGAGRRRGPSLGLAVGLFVVAAGLTIGLRPLGDNSFLTHLATGRLILDRGAVPTADPYTFTAAGEPWVVQSWLASWLYATSEAVGGALGLRLVVGAVAAALAAVVWALARPADGIVLRLGLAGLVLAVGAQQWAERPFMIGLVGLGITVLAGDGRVDPRWLVPVGWVWANSHGSFPLGLVHLAVAALGARLDGRRPAVELRALGWAAAGAAIAVLGPLGPRVLLFPVELLGRQDVLSNVIEWRAPTFVSFSQRAFVVQLAVAVVLLVRRPSYRAGLVLAVFGAMALLSARNLTVASLVLVPQMAEAVRGVGTLRADQRPAVARLLAATGLAAVVVLAGVRLGQRDFELRRYPIDAIAFLDEAGIDPLVHRVATQDVTGNVLELLYGADGRVFYDDRFDMFPAAVTESHLALVNSAPDLRSELDAFDVQVVVWERQSPTGQRLIVDPGWRVLYTDERHVVVCSRGADLGGRVGRC